MFGGHVPMTLQHIVSEVHAHSVSIPFNLTIDISMKSYLRCLSTHNIHTLRIERRHTTMPCPLYLNTAWVGLQFLLNVPILDETKTFSSIILIGDWNFPIEHNCHSSLRLPQCSGPFGEFFKYINSCSSSVIIIYMDLLVRLKINR